MCTQAQCQQRHVLQYKAKFGGMDVREASRLKTLEGENAGSKRS